MPPTVRDAAFDVLRGHGLTTLFANPGSTEIALLSDLPGDLRFVLGLHESSVVGMATGLALGRGEPALAILHTTPGLGNAVSAIATARVNRVPLVVARRAAGPAPHRLGAVPHGAAAGARGRLPGLGRPAAAARRASRRRSRAPTTRPSRGAVPRSSSCRWTTGPPRRRPPRSGPRRGRWCAPPGGRRRRRRAARRARRRAPRSRRSSSGPGSTTRTRGRLSSRSRSGWRARSGRSRSADGRGSRRITRCSPGISPADRPRLRQALAPHDLVIAVGAPAFRQYPSRRARSSSPARRSS